MTIDSKSFKTRLNFAHECQRGYRAPNRYSVWDPDELKMVSTNAEVTIHNARLLNPKPTLESHGFELINVTHELDLLNTEVVVDEYFKICREVLKKATGCEEVRGGGYEYRNGFGGESGRRGVSKTPNGSGGAYAQGIHSDMCAVVEQAFSKVLPENRHFESINLWQSVKKGETVQTMPLVVCDINSVDPRDIVFGDGTATGNIKQYYKVVDQRVIYSPKQRWYYFPEMRDDEMLIFKQYDTRQEELNRRTVFHSAAQDPSTPNAAPMRYSIEVRMQAIFGVDDDKEARLTRFMSQISDTYRNGQKCDWWRGPIENYVPPAM